MGSSSCNQHVTVEIGEEFQYPYPSHVHTPSFVILKLSGKENYSNWETQMICLFKSHDMLGFIDGTFVSPQTSTTTTTTTSSVTGKEKVAGDDQLYHRLRLWARSDALVKGWIIGSLSENTLTQVLNHLKEKQLQQRNAAAEDSTAKDVWDELHTIYGRPQLLSDEEEKERDKVVGGDHQLALHDVIFEGSLDKVDDVLRLQPVTVTDKLTKTGNTALHLALIRTESPEFFEKILERAPENTKVLEVTNLHGYTLLHFAAVLGHSEAAKILVEREPTLLFARDNGSHTPLFHAEHNMQSEMSQFLLHHMKIAIRSPESGVSISSISGDELPSILISCKEFGLALDLLKHQETVANDDELMAVAQNFPGELNMFERYTGTSTLSVRISYFYQAFIGIVYDRCEPFCCTLCNILVLTILSLFLGGIIFIFINLPLLLIKMLARPFIKKRIQANQDAKQLLEKVCTLISHSNGPYHPYYTKPLFEVTRQNAYEAVYIIVNCFSDAIWNVNEDGHNIVQYAVINRSEKVYNLLNHRKHYKDRFRKMKDSSGNNLLHLAARLAPAAKLNRISGAALQVQSELQWFKELEGYISPLHITQRNSFNETPQMVFAREHKDLVIEGEKWLKSAAESYTITAALITTIVFATAISVPGGSNDSGIPIFTHNNAFKIFAISDAISLFTSVTSLLMFLSILTTRFAEKDFLFKLPTQLIIGLTTLFISTTAMIIAFGATLYLVFGQGNSRLLIPIAVLTCLPITSFVTLQIPFIIELISSTYGRSIFRKKLDDMEFYQALISTAPEER